jgi:hypothetical protein
MNVKVDDVYGLPGCDTERFGDRVQNLSKDPTAFLFRIEG